MDFSCQSYATLATTNIMDSVPIFIELIGYAFLIFWISSN